MGFTVGYTRHLLPSLFLATLSLLGFLRSFILFLLRLLGRSDFLQPGSTCPDPPHYPARPGSPSASKIREMLPALKFADMPAGAETPESCAVCLLEFEDDDEIRRLRCCTHVFHRSCVDRWMDHGRTTCPLCRTPFVPKESLWSDFCGECRPLSNFF